jgi:hypothetical protein
MTAFDVEALRRRFPALANTAAEVDRLVDALGRITARARPVTTVGAAR